MARLSKPIYFTNLFYESIFGFRKRRVVQDNYNTHSYGSFYENLPNEQARELKNKLEFHVTLKQKNWIKRIA